MVIGCDLNPHYVTAWPAAARAWESVVEIEPVLVLVADPTAVPPELRDDPRVHFFPPVPGVHTALQAQCIRLLYPALLPDDGAVLTTDVDMVPANRGYFERPLCRIGERDFVSYRDVLLDLEEVPICYNAALPSTWGEIFGVESAEDVRARLGEWAAGVDYEGVRGGAGWITDQRVLYTRLLEWSARTSRVWMLDDYDTGHRRLDRYPLAKAGTLDDKERRRLRRGYYSDFHLVLPHPDHQELNDEVIALAAAAASRGGAAAG